MTDRNYAYDARDDAKETVLEFINQVVEQLEQGSDASDDLFNDYPDGDAWHNESHVDKDYTLREAAEVLHQLSEHKEDDYGLWESLPPVRAVIAQAAYTYGNAVYAAWRELIDHINCEYTNLEEPESDDIDDAVRAWVADFR